VSCEGGVGVGIRDGGDGLCAISVSESGTMVSMLFGCSACVGRCCCVWKMLLKGRELALYSGVCWDRVTCRPSRVSR